MIKTPRPKPEVGTHVGHTPYVVWAMSRLEPGSFNLVGKSLMPGSAKATADSAAWGDGYSYVVLWEDDEAQVVYDTLSGWDCCPEAPYLLRRLFRRR